MLSLEFGLSSDLFPDPLDAPKCAKINQSGFRFIEIMGRAPHYDMRVRDLPTRWRPMLEEHGLRVHSFHIPYGELYHPDASQWPRARQTIEQSMDHLVALGGELLILHAGGLTGTGSDIDEPVQRALRNLEEVLDLCSAHGADLRICLEHEGENIEGILEILNRTDDPRVGFCFDSGHAQIYPGNFDFLTDFAGRIYAVHLSDNLGHSDDHLPPYKGIVDWTSLVPKLLESSYLGPWHLEVSPGQDSYRTLADMVESMHRIEALLRS